MRSTLQADNKSFQENLGDVAQRCANGANIYITWHNFLSTILKNWNADIQMDLHDAVDIMLSAAGLNKFINYKGFPEYFHSFNVSFNVLDLKPNKNKIKFWYKLPFLKKIQIRKRIFMMTISVFETINYWCWYDSPVSISFNRDSLINTLNNGSISINWALYQRQL